MRYVCLLLSLCLFMACGKQQRTISFYYWKTIFHLGETEKEVLADNAVTTLYVRYCDVDFLPGASSPQPVSPVTLDTSARNFKIIPVVFIKNRTFQKLDTAGVSVLAKNVFNLISGISNKNDINTGEIQFDCDWTESTKDNYFLFLNEYRSISNQVISATIRLHQVKYPLRTGIPPIDHGVLMYYNMGQINADAGNSIFETSIAERYNAFISAYPLKLDVALPVFSWGLKIRNGKVVDLLNKFYFAHFKNDSNFNSVSANRFITKNACFKGGYYFAQGDEVKIESISAGNLMQMTEQLSKHAGDKIRNLIFYDLDSSNLVQYEKDIFKKVVDRIN